MWRLSVTASVLLVCGLLLIYSPAAGNENSVVHNGLLHHIETDAAMYWMYGSVEIAYSITNVTAETLRLGFTCLESTGVYRELGVRIYPPSGPCVWADPPGCYWIVWYDELAPGASFSMAPIWDMTDDDTGHYVSQAGVYRIKGSDFIDDPEYNYSVTVEVELLDPSTGAPEQSPTAWSTIKALYR